MVSCSWKQTLGRFALDSSFEKYFDCYTDDIGKACLAYLSNGIWSDEGLVTVNNNGL